MVWLDGLANSDPNRAKRNAQGEVAIIPNRTPSWTSPGQIKLVGEGNSEAGSLAHAFQHLLVPSAQSVVSVRFRSSALSSTDSQWTYLPQIHWDQKDVDNMCGALRICSKWKCCRDPGSCPRRDVESPQSMDWCGWGIRIRGVLSSLWTCASVIGRCWECFLTWYELTCHTWKMKVKVLLQGISPISPSIYYMKLDSRRSHIL